MATPEKKDRRRILFLCTGSSARSQLAEGLAREVLSGDWEVHSAGTIPVGVNPLAIQAMRERGIDIGKQRSKGLDEVPTTADVMVTLCAAAAGECPTYPGATRVFHWNLPDPSFVPGSDNQKLDAFRNTRDEIEKRLQKLSKELTKPNPSAA